MRIKIFLLTLACLLETALLMAQSFDPIAKTEELMYLMKNKKYEGVLMRCDADMQRFLDPEKLEAIWEGMIMSYGEVKEVAKPKLISTDSLIITLTKVTYQKSAFGFKLVFNKQGLLTGLWLDAPEVKYSPAAYVDASRFYEYKKKLPDPQYPSEAVLTIPARAVKCAVVIIVGGSGPTDKDLSMGPNKPYKDIAWGLGSEGIATLRYNKRTLDFGSAMMKENPHLTAKEEYLDDLNRALQLIRNYPELDTNRIFILGHSEGAYLIPYFEKNLKGIAGYISFAGPYRDLEVILEEQLIFLQKLAGKKEKASYDTEIARCQYAKTHLRKETPADSLPLKMDAQYLLFLRKNSPAALHQVIMNKPVLLVNGKRDYQVPYTETELWKQALKGNTHLEITCFEGLNHLGLKGSGEPNPDEYEKQGNIPQEFISRLVQFISNH